MQVLWNKNFTNDSPWEPFYDGVFHEHDGEVRFFFTNGSGVVMLKESAEAWQTVCHINTTLPCSWMLVDSFLFLENRIRQEMPFKDKAIDLCTLQMTENIPDSVRARYNALLKPMLYYVEETVSHGEYCISHKGEWGYECTKNGEKIWQFRGYAWLYTDIHFWNDRVFFGTSGQGGYFYVLDLETGEPLTKLKTGGTEHIVQIGNLCYVLQNGKHASIVCVDLRDGKIRETLPLMGTAGYRAVIQQVGQRLHTITFNTKNGRMNSAYWSCVALP